MNSFFSPLTRVVSLPISIKREMTALPNQWGIPHFSFSQKRRSPAFGWRQCLQHSTSLSVRRPLCLAAEDPYGPLSQYVFVRQLSPRQRDSWHQAATLLVISLLYAPDAVPKVSLSEALRYENYKEDYYSRKPEKFNDIEWLYRFLVQQLAPFCVELIADVRREDKDNLVTFSHPALVAWLRAEKTSRDLDDLYKEKELLDKKTLIDIDAADVYNLHIVEDDAVGYDTKEQRSLYLIEVAQNFCCELLIKNKDILSAFYAHLYEHGILHANEIGSICICHRAQIFSMKDLLQPQLQKNDLLS